MYHLEAKGRLQQAWIQEAGKGSDNDSRLTAPPVVAGGKIYVLDSQAHVFAFNAQGGQPLWDQSLAPSGKSSFMYDASFGAFGSTTKVNPAKGFGGGLASDGGEVLSRPAVQRCDRVRRRQRQAPDARTISACRSSMRRWRVAAACSFPARTIIFYALAQTDGRKLWDHQGIEEIRRHPAKHQRGGGEVNSSSRPTRRARSMPSACRTAVRRGTICSPVPAM